MSGHEKEVVKTHGLEALGIGRKAPTHWNPPAPAL